MIAASEPLEFVPHGRTVLEKHPAKIYSKGRSSSISEHSLLYKLTNFGIKDESLLETRDVEEREWWCVREVYSCRSEDFEDDQAPTTKETKDEYMSESFRPQSHLKNEFNISIKSELMAGGKKMETDCASARTGSSRTGSANSSSNMSKKFNLSSGTDRKSKNKLLNPKTDCCFEEELYVKGCTAVWSKGLISTPATRLSGPETRETISCFTIENPIKHAVFCNFHVTINNTMLIDALNSQIGDAKKNIKIEDTTEHLQTKNMPSILLIDNKNARVYAKDGREYVTSIPFQVKKVWPMKYGVLLEKDATPMIHNSLLPMSFLKLNESNNSTFTKSRSNFPFNMSARLRQESMSTYDHDVPLPTCFSMSHPLDEVTPLLMKSPSHGLQYYNDGDLQIIFVSTTPSIILLYDWKLGTHSLWRIRKALREECLTMCPNINSTTAIFSQSCDFAASPLNSHVKNATSAGSPYQSKKGTGTPIGSRLNSPLATMFHQQGLSPHTSIGQASSTSMLVNTAHQAPPTLPLYPDICLDHIWTDTQNIRRDPVENPNDLKSFLHTDLVGHNYLCFIMKVGGVSKLQIMRLQKSHSLGQSSKMNTIVGSISSVMAKDAVVLEHLQMMALIDETGNIILQSGNSVVGKVHVGGVLARLIDSPYTKRSTFQSPFPRRSSLLPSRSSDAPVFDDSALHLLSPVPHSSARIVEQKESFGLQSLCDTAGNRLTLRFDKGVMYRITLPDIACSSLVAKCCTALKAILPKDVTMQVIIKWYGTRNAPGTQDLTPEQEWSMFANLLYSLIGYDLERLSLPRKTDDMGETSEVATKKQRTSSDGTQDDWDYLLNSKLHKTFGNSLANMLNLSQTKSETKSHRPTFGRKKSQTEEKSNQFNSNSVLFPYTAQVLYAFHLVYEDTKLNTLLLSELEPLSHFLCQLAKDMKLEKYVTHYWLDFPTEYSLEFEDTDSQMSENHLKKLIQPTYFSMEPPSFFSYLNCMLKDVDAGYYPYLAEVNNMSRDLIEVLTTIGCGRSAGIQTISSRDTMTASSTPRTRRDYKLHLDPNTRAVLLLAERGMTLCDVENLPPAVSLLLLNILSAGRSDPPQGCCELVMRPELATMEEDQAQDALGLEVQEKETAYTLCRVPDIECVQNKSDDKDYEMKTGMEHLDTKLLRLLYPRDHRMSEVLGLLQSSTPVTINLTQRADVSDHDFIEEQEKYLYAVSGRTMATPVARGMLTLRTLPCVPTEPLTLPKLCVSGRGPPPRCNNIELSQDSPGCLAWPQFHNGCAAGLAAVPAPGYSMNAAQEKYNKPKGSQEISNEHAGFLMALGLNGHLKSMPYMNIYEYLVKSQEMISVGLLLGLAATYRGSMDIQATKTMSIHLEPLLPPTSIELDIHQNVLVAALLGIGLIYQKTQHTHYAHVLLNEIGKPTGPDTENCWSREGYALAAGLALGLVCVASDVPPAIATQLRLYMLGGSAKEKPKQGTVNLDVTSPGATLALGLIYLGSGNQAVAGWLEPPQTSYLLDAVRPDFLMLRCIARGLILWHEVEPDLAWVENQVPATIKPYCFVKPTEDNIDYEAMNQAYCNIVAGACFTLGLRFAGSGNEDARDTLLHYTHLFLTLAGKSLGELAGKSTLESCLCVCLLAAGMVMSGRGDIPVLRVCRRLRARVPTAPVSSRTPALSHGPQMAVHCTIGLLFLGGGRCTLSTDPASIAALLAAFFPKFPTHSEDNRYHLQAFRHLYVLAVEPRLILPRDLSTGRLCYAHIQVVDLQGSVKEMKAPCILPQLDTLREVRISESRYWPIVYRRDTNWEQLEKFLKHTWCVDIKPRAGCLSHLDDPEGYHTILAHTLTLGKTNIWSATPDNIELFTRDVKVRSFTEHYLATLQNIKDKLGANICADCLLLDKKKGKKSGKSDTLMSKQCYCRKNIKEEMEFVQGLSMVTYECVLKDILCELPVWATFLKILKSLKTEPSSYHIWQIKLLLSHIENRYKRTLNEMKIDDEEPLQHEMWVSNEFTIAIGQKVGEIFDSVETKIQPYLRKYLGLPSCKKIGNSEDQVKKILSAFIVYHDIPRCILKKGAWRGQNFDNSLSLMLELENSNLSANTVSKIEALL